MQVLLSSYTPKRLLSSSGKCGYMCFINFSHFGDAANICGVRLLNEVWRYKTSQLKADTVIMLVTSSNVMSQPMGTSECS